jgi:phosphoglycerate dehydrogenase-like enzyme
MPSPADTKIVLCIWHPFDQWRVPAWLPQALAVRYSDLRVAHLPDYTGLDAAITDADIFAGFSLKPEQFASAKRLKWIHCLAAGVNQLMRDDIRASSVVITNSRNVHAACMAEHTGLFLARRAHPSAAPPAPETLGAAGNLNEQPRPMEISGRTLTIVGYGAIGQELARARWLAACACWGETRRHRGAEHAEAVVAPDKMEAVLGEADFVVLATPALPETQHLFGAAQFAAMKKTAYFINIGRGVLVEAEALLAALRKGQIAGAAIDVAEFEPLAPESPLWEAPNLLITPHLSGVSERLWHRHAALLFENLGRYFAGRELLNVVDKRRGY